MNLQEQINYEIGNLPIMSQKEVLDFVLFLKTRFHNENDTVYLSKNADIKHAIIDGLHTSLDECVTELDW
jgi:hypothetical protein